MVDQAVKPLGERGGQAPVEGRVEPFEVLGHVVADKDRVEAQRMTLPRALAVPDAAEVNAPYLEGVREEPLFGLVVEGVLRCEGGAGDSSQGLAELLVGVAGAAPAEDVTQLGEREIELPIAGHAAPQLQELQDRQVDVLVQRAWHPQLRRGLNLPALHKLRSAFSLPTALEDQLIFFAVPGLHCKERILLQVGLRPDERLVRPRGGCARWHLPCLLPCCSIYIKQQYKQQ